MVQGNREKFKSELESMIRNFQALRSAQVCQSKRKSGQNVSQCYTGLFGTVRGQRTASCFLFLSALNACVAGAKHGKSSVEDVEI